MTPEIFKKKIAADKYDLWILGLDTRPDFKIFLTRGLVFVFCFINIVLAAALATAHFKKSFYDLPDWEQGSLAIFVVALCLLLSAVLSRFLNIWAYKKSK